MPESIILNIKNCKWLSWHCQLLLTANFSRSRSLYAIARLSVCRL